MPSGRPHGDRWIWDLRDVGSVCWNIGTIGNRLQGVTKALDDFSLLNMELITGIQPEEVNDQGTTSVLVTIGPQTVLSGCRSVDEHRLFERDDDNIEIH